MIEVMRQRLALCSKKNTDQQQKPGQQRFFPVQ